MLYFIKKGSDRDHVLSLAKLKTLEYRLFRKMREKLRGFYSTAKNEILDINNLSHAKFEEKVRSFKKESEEFLEDGQNSLPEPLEYYVNVFKSAWDFIKQDRTQVHVLHNEYVTFSENLLEFIKKTGGAGADKAFFVSDVLDKQMDITYGAGQDVEMTDHS